MADTQSEGSKALDQQEHNADASAKRVIMRYQDPDTGAWLNVVPDKVAGVDFDYIDGQQTSTSIDTYVFKDGGSGGTTVQTITITYTDDTKENIDTIAWS